MNYSFLVLIILLVSCGERNTLESKDENETTTYISNDTIPLIREEVSKKPVASYHEPIGKPKINGKFGVAVYETPKTFEYLLRMQYEWMEVSDTLKLPNFGTWPEVQVRKGKEKRSCIIGFLDKKKQFKEYKQLIVQNDELKLKVLKSYFVGVYRDTKEESLKK